MPKAILAIRTYPATVILAMLLFLATLAITTGSMGKVTTSGGDGGDGGSGIGGTGRSGEFGGSGFGGTGGPSPFVTSAESGDRETNSPAAGDVPILVLVENTEAPATQVASTPDQQIPEKSTASGLQRAITESIEQNALVKQSELILAVDDAPEPTAPVAPAVEVAAPQLMQIVEAPQLEIPVIPAAREPEVQKQAAVLGQEYELAFTTESAADEPVTVEESGVDIPMLLEQQAKTTSVKLETAESDEPEIGRGNIPDRIQRPDLPPILRIRPVERVSIMPPRVQPMRL